jgi:tetratricopeptide (TPR) repeat protein
MTMRLIRLGLTVSLFAATCPAIAQEEDPAALEELDRQKQQQSAPVVEVQGAAELRSALMRIARQPTDSGALVDAGNAALLLGDANAALNFFTRADALQPSSGRIKLGLAIAKVRTENPFEALRLFDEAIRLGIPERAVAADRALAFDLLGNFGRAQQDYVLARQSDRSNRLIVQQAISIALLGKEGEADAILYPLLQQNYGEAWRARAFLLAARGDYKESVKVTQGFMDARSAQQFERYLRQMPQLTGAQKAAAIHLGHFPANNIGRDSETLQRVAANYPQSGPSGDGRLVPSGDPFGPKSGAQTRNTAKLSRRERERAAKRAAQDVQVPASIARPVSEVADLGARLPLPIEIARTRILEAEKLSFTLVAVAPRPPVSAVVFQPAAQPAVAALPAVKSAEQPVVTANQSPPPGASPTQTPPLQPAVVMPEATVAARPPIAQPVIFQPAAPQPAVQRPAIAQNAAQQAPSPVFSAPPPAFTPGTQPQVNQPANPQLPPLSSPPAIAPGVGAADNTLPNTVAGTPVQNAAVTTPVQATPSAAITTEPLAQTTSEPASALPSTGGIPGVIPQALPQQATTQSPPQTLPEPLPSAGDSAPAVTDYRPATPASLAQAPAPSAPPVSPAFDLGAVVNGIDIPEIEKQRDVVPVDLKKLPVAAPKPKDTAISDDKKPKMAQKAPEPPETERLWVQVATGGAAQFSSDMRIFRKKYADLFKNRDSWSSPWGKQSRLLIGPFADVKIAKKWEADFRKAGGDGFVWRSEKGVEVKPLKSK